MAKPVWITLEGTDGELLKKNQRIKLSQGQTVTIGRFSSKEGQTPLATMRKYIRKFTRQGGLTGDERDEANRNYDAILGHQLQATVRLGPIARFRANAINALASHGFPGALRTKHMNASTRPTRQDDEENTLGIHIIGTHAGDFLHFHFISPVIRNTPKNSKSRNTQIGGGYVIPVEEILQAPVGQQHKLKLPNGVVVHFYGEKPKD